MSKEEIKKLTRNEMEKFIKTNLDSFIIFMYVQNLEEELDKKDKIIKEKIEEYEEILQSSIIKEDYKKEVEHIIRVLKELKGDN